MTCKTFKISPLELGSARCSTRFNSFEKLSFAPPTFTINQLTDFYDFNSLFVILTLFVGCCVLLWNRVLEIRHALGLTILNSPLQRSVLLHLSVGDHHVTGTGFGSRSMKQFNTHFTGFNRSLVYLLEVIRLEAQAQQNFL